MNACEVICHSFIDDQHIEISHEYWSDTPYPNPDAKANITFIYTYRSDRYIERFCLPPALNSILYRDSILECPAEVFEEEVFTAKWSSRGTMSKVGFDDGKEIRKQRLEGKGYKRSPFHVGGPLVRQAPLYRPFYGLQPRITPPTLT